MKMKLIFGASALVLLTACANDTPTKIAEPEARASSAVSDAEFRKQDWPKDSSGVTKPKDATASTRAAQAAAAAIAPKNIAKEQDFATRGFIATWDKPQIARSKGNAPSMDLAANDFIKGDAPDTVNPMLWQHGKFMGASEGLFKVTDGIYQVRGFDVANVTFVETDSGYIVIDPLNAGEASRAAYDLIKQHVGDKPVKAVIYTHSHSDHFAGISGVVDLENPGDIQIIAPVGFMDETAKEWLTAGNAMGRRAFYQFAMFVPDGPRGYVGVGQGPGISLGEHNLLPPTHEITKTGETLNIDGTEVIFQLTPGAEAPAEMNFYFPKYKAICMAETVNASIHNVQTLRGANVRDAKEWADYLTEAIDLFGGKAETLFITHHWPRFGQDEVVDFIGKQRDMYKYTHDQTVRMMNQGLTPDEIAENLVLPESLGGEWYNRGFYGSLSHNSKAVYDKYMGWYDGNPSVLNRHIPTERARRYVDAIGGADEVMRVGGQAFDSGDYRWSAEVVQHLVFADPKNQAARELLADSYEQMGYQAESAIWRNIYLSGAKELRQGKADVYTGGNEDYLMDGASDEQILDLLAVRLLPDRAAGQERSVNVVFEDTGNEFNLRLKNSVLTYHKGKPDPDAGTITASRKGFLAVSLGFLGLGQAKLLMGVDVEGDGAALQEIGEMMDKPSLDFNIIEP